MWLYWEWWGAHWLKQRDAVTRQGIWDFPRMRVRILIGQVSLNFDRSPCHSLSCTTTCIWAKKGAVDRNSLKEFQLKVKYLVEMGGINQPHIVLWLLKTSDLLRSIVLHYTIYCTYYSMYIVYTIYITQKYCQKHLAIFLPVSFKNFPKCVIIWSQNEKCRATKNITHSKWSKQLWITPFFLFFFINIRNCCTMWLRPQDPVSSWIQSSTSYFWVCSHCIHGYKGLKYILGPQETDIMRYIETISDSKATV